MKRLSLLAVLLSVSCSPAPQAPPAVTPEASPAATSTRARPANGASTSAPTAEPLDSNQDLALEQQLRSALAYVSSIRQLPAREPVQGRTISRSEIAKYLTSELDAETPPDVMQATEALLYGFGTVGPDFDFRSSVLTLMTSQLLGFYDPKQKTFFVGRDLHGDELRVTLWHELVHALQDQHYDLSHLADWEPDEGDRQSAVHGLAEGDATSAMLDALLKPRGGSALEVPDGLLRADAVLGSASETAPPVLVRSLLAPYIDGLAFTNELRRRGGFAAVDAAWKHPPLSTEQLLHPDKFLAGEAPLSVPLPPPPALAPELKERFHDVMGEQTLRILLEEWLPARTAAAAAADWGGDRLSVFADDARTSWAVAWHLRFDSSEAGQRAYRALARAAPLTDRAAQRPSQPDPTPPRGDKLCRPRHSQGPLALVRRGADVSVTLGPFSRTPVTVTRDPDCRAALAWATSAITN